MRSSSRRSDVISATVVAAMVVVTASPALAKGPESMTLTGPGIDSPVELDTTESGLLRRAMEQTGLWWSTRGDRPLPIAEPPPGELGSGYTLTRVLSGGPGERGGEPAVRQVVYPFAQGGVVVHTPSQEGLRGAAEGAGWFEAPALQETLARLGVPVAAASSLREGHPPELAEDAPPQRQRVGASSSSSSFVLAGLGLAVLAVVIGARRRLHGLGSSEHPLHAD